MKIKTANFILFLMIFTFQLYPSVQACDDTLVMLLTAKNPNSEFSRTIRKFTTNLSTLGVALKNPLNKDQDFSNELQAVMQAWIDFTTRYMTNPPPEARNDRNWVKKMQQTSRRIGKLRRLIGNKKFMTAHNLVLDISSEIGKFFEAVGISDEKKLFIETSTNATILENMVLQNKNQKAFLALASLTINLKDFKPLVPETASSTTTELKNKLAILENQLKNSENIKHLDPEVVKITALFEQLRSLILMQEWFPETTDQDEEGTN
ncbi:MAG: hypothetical protein ACQETH_03655 [Candidatus Rifleibacteriota bacterium]